MSEDEAKEFADAAVNVAKHYDVGASAKALAWTDLAMVAGGIYGLRVMQIMGDRNAARSSGSPAQPPAGQAANGRDKTAAPGIDLTLMTGGDTPVRH